MGNKRKDVKSGGNDASFSRKRKKVSCSISFLHKMKSTLFFKALIDETPESFITPGSHGDPPARGSPQ